jgi:hypothetical protein
MYYLTNEMPPTYHTIIAIDWADTKHDFRIRTEDGEKVLTLANDLPKLKDFFLEILEDHHWQKVAIVIENTQSALMHLLQSIVHFDVFAVHPTTASSYARTFCPSGAKNDTSDTASLMDLFCKHPEKIRLLNINKDAHLLRTYSEKRRETVDERKKSTCQMIALLKKYYPVDLKVIGDNIYSRNHLDFLEKWSTPQKLKQANKSTLTRFFNKRTNKKSLTPIRVEAVQACMCVVDDDDLTELYETQLLDLHRRIKVFNESIHVYDTKLKQHYEKNIDHLVFDSFPGSGPVMGPRLMAFFGNDRSKFGDVREALQHSEIAPVLTQSGKTKVVKRRYMCSKFRQQTFVEFADGSRKKSLWAQEFYKRKKAQGKSHYTILRALAFKWIRIIYKCWIDQVSYDENKYLKALQKLNSPLVKNSLTPSTVEVLN